MEYCPALQRNEILTLGSNMDKPWAHYTKWKKPDMKGQILYDSTHMKYLEESSA